MENVIMLIMTGMMLASLGMSRTVLNLASDFPYNETILRNYTGLEYEVDISTVPPGNYISFKFQVTTTPLLTSMFLAVSPNRNDYTVGSLKIADLYGTNYTEVDGEIDIVSLQLGKTQYINRKKVGSGVDDNLYLTVYYLDPDYRKIDANFTIYLQTYSSAGTSPSCYPCVNGHGRKYPGTTNCVCSQCDPGYYGPDCSINMLTLTNGQPSSASVNGPGMAFFLIDQSSQISLLVKQSVGMGEIYFQFINFDGEFASYTNVAQGQNMEGRFLSTAGTSGTSFGAVSTGTRMSLTVAVYNVTTTNIEVSYSVGQTSNVLVIVLSVLGGVLFVGLVIAGIYIVKNSRWLQGRRESRQVRPIQENLNNEEIQRFFPTVLLKNTALILRQQESNVQLNENQSPSKPKLTIQDCVICLCPIQPQEQIKVTYCKHLFHSHCLIGWFKKQQNCPYCREQFTKTNTVKLYKKVKQSFNGSVLKGEQLINAIIESKSHIILNKESIQTLQQKSPRKIQVGHRNQIQIQNLS